jgi:hypothetical protein
MEVNLFTARSIWTMVHGIVLAGGVLLALGAALYSLGTARATDASSAGAQLQTRYLVWLLAAIAILLWLTVIVGTYVNFPPYRATPPAGITDLSRYPRSLIQSNPQTVWLHSFAMEVKEHVPWIAAMMATAVAFVAVRYRSTLLADTRLRNMVLVFLTICFALVSFAGLLGVFINKVAPLD